MIKPEVWILLALKDASQEYGFDINKWLQFEKPKEFDIHFTNFQSLIDGLEEKGILKRALKEQVNFYLSEKGKKELAALKKQMTFKEYILVISNFPIIELKERVKSLESFVLSSIILGIGSVVLFGLSQILISYGRNITYVILFLYFVFTIIASYYIGNNLGIIILFRTNDMRKETLWIYKEWYWDNRDVINKVITGLFTIIIIGLLDYLQISTVINSFVLLLLGIIAILLWETFTK
jgi:hypothetical protein